MRLCKLFLHVRFPEKRRAMVYVFYSIDVAVLRVNARSDFLSWDLQNLIDFTTLIAITIFCALRRIIV